MMQNLQQPYNLSFWELNTVFRNVDLVIVGAGIVGLNAALHLKKQNQKAKILILERGILPYGASTKNAGFACFGSITEIISDFKNNDKNIVLETIEMRIKGLQKLQNIVGKKNMDYEKCGGYELFFDAEKYKAMQNELPFMNEVFQQLLNKKNVWKIAPKKLKAFGFKNTTGIIENIEEGAINTGKMMHALYKICIANNIKILNNITVNSFQENGNGVTLNINEGFEIDAKKLIIASNGFAKQLLPQLDVNPARAQVLITKPIDNLKVKGTFHFDEGFYYFRNVGNRILFGGARNADFIGEKTTEFGTSHIVQESLLHYLQTTILPNTPFEIEHTWSGIMGIGNNKKPIIKAISKNVFCSVKMGGMGVAIGSLAGAYVANLASNS